MEADANADAVVTAIALPVLTYRRANKRIVIETYFECFVFW